MRKLIILYCTMLVLVLSSCQDKQAVTMPSPEEISVVQPMGDEISTELLKTLQNELQQAIQSGGIKEAINVCNLKAIPLTGIVEKSTKSPVEIKRTSLRYRNEKNAPDEFELIALNHYESLMASNDEIPPFYIQKINAEESSFYNYYKPLTMKPICLTCHGSNEMIGEETLTLIRELYPEDKATGYSEGDFRGLVRIKFSEF